MKIVSFLVVLMITNVFVHGQDQSIVFYPKVGDIMKDHEFTDLENFPKKSVRVSDFRGKWLILDFWSRNCVSCIASFPKMDKIHRQFRDKVQLIMVGLKSSRDSTGQQMRAIYHRMKSLHQLDFTVAYDLLAATKYDIGALPAIFIINPEGKIVAKTISIKADQIMKLLQGEIPMFKRMFSRHETIDYENTLPMLTTGGPSNGGNDTSFLFRSLLKPYDYHLPFIVGYLTDDNEIAVKSGRLEMSKVSLKQLYFTAYFGSFGWTPHLKSHLYGKYAQEIILEVDDSSNFDVDQATLKGLYSYSLIVPKHRSSKDFMKQVMQSDLKNYFGYFVSIEKRMMPAYHLIVTDPIKVQKLKTKGGESTVLWSDKYKGISFINRRLWDFKSYFSFSLPVKNGSSPPLFDKTGIDFNLDFTINTDMFSLERVNDRLSEAGLEIVEGVEEMETMVIRDDKAEHL